MSFDFFPNEAAATMKRAASMPSTTPDPSMFAGFGSGVVDYTMEGFAKTARAIDLAGAVGPIISDALTGGTGARDQYFAEHDAVFSRSVDYWTPPPGSVGTAGRVVGSLVPVISEFVANPILPILTAELGTAEDLAKQLGVSGAQAVGAGVVQGTGLALGAYLPILGKTLLSKIGIGAASNVGQGIVTRAATEKILEGTESAKQFNPWDKEGLVIDALMGAAFGGVAHLGEKPAAFTPTDEAAILTANQARHIEDTTAPGLPKSDADRTGHSEALMKAIDDVLSDKTAEVGQKLRDVEFSPDPAKVAARQQVSDELHTRANDVLLEEMREQNSTWTGEQETALNQQLREAQRLGKLAERSPEKYAEFEQAANLAEDMRIAKLDAMTKPIEVPESRGAQTPAKTAGAEQKVSESRANAKGEPSAPVDPAILEAQQRLAEFPDMAIRAGEDADGNAITVNLGEQLRLATEEVARAQAEAPGVFQTAATCLLGNA